MLRALAEIALGVHIVQVASVVRAVFVKRYPVIEMWRAFNRFAALPTNQAAFCVGLRRTNGNEIVGSVTARRVLKPGAAAVIALSAVVGTVLLRRRRASRGAGGRT